MDNNYFGNTDTGRVRTNNEDTFLAKKINNQLILACVIDGVGGYDGGEVAAELAKEAILKHLANPAPDYLTQLKATIIAANDSIQQEKINNQRYSRMACVVTLALADVSNNKFYYAHVGDTRLYLLRDKSLVKITRDQSFVGFLEDNGRISEAEAMAHPNRNEINKALGFDSELNGADYIETGDSPFLPGDMLLLCSDGLTDMINSSRITGILNDNGSIDEKANALIAAANAAGGKDNITVVLVENNREHLQQTAVKPAVQKKNHNETVKTNPIVETIEKPVSGKVGHRRNITVPVLGILLLVAIAASGWLYFQLKEMVAEEQAMLPFPGIKRNATEQGLIDQINQPLTQQVTIDANTGNLPIVITDTIFINKDSLVIHGNGAILTGDSAFSGPAFVLADNCRYVVLEGITFTNFYSAISVQTSGLHLKNTRFINCNIPVVQQFVFPGNVLVSGSLPGNLFHTDSIPK